MRRDRYDAAFTRKQILGVTLMVLCFWVCIIGIYWAIVKDVSDGLIVSGAGAIGSGAMRSWLIFIHPDKQ